MSKPEGLISTKDISKKQSGKLKDYVTFLQNYHYEDIFLENYSRLKEQLEGWYANTDSETVFYFFQEFYFQSFLLPLLHDDPVFHFKQYLHKWHEPLFLPELKKVKLKSRDVLFLYHARKSTLLSFLQFYPCTKNESLEIVQEIEDYFLDIQSLSLQDFNAAQNQHISEQELLLSQISAATPNVIYIADIIENRNIYSSKGILDLLGYTEKEVIEFGANTMEKLLHPEDISLFYEQIEKYKNAKDGEIVECEYRIRHKDGNWRWFYKRGIVFKRNEKGEVVQYLGVLVDITSAKVSEIKLREASELAKVGHWVIDFRTEDVEWSDLLYNIHEFEEKTQVKIADILSYVHPEDQEKLQRNFMGYVERKEAGEYEHRIITKKGNIRYLAAKALPVFNPDNGEVIAMKGYVQDVTQKKLIEHELHLAQQQLRNLNIDLERKVEERTKELSVKNHQLQQINNDLDNFIYTASHDLKAPISNLEGLLVSLERNLSPESRNNKVVEQVVAFMTTSINRLKKTISELTDIAKLQKQFQESSTISFKELIDEVQFDLASLIQQSNAKVELSFEECPSIKYSRKNLKSIIYNLLSNALKYRSLDRVPEILIHTCYQDDHVVLTVRDNGLGIEEKNFTKIFSMFKRLHTHVEGSGIGLYIVKKMVDNAGGKIEVESTLGRGSTFKVYFKMD